MRWLLLVGVLVIMALVGCVLWLNFGPDPRISLSRDTTYITEPLSQDGLPDYLEYLRRKSANSIAPESNAAVLIWQAVGPSSLPQSAAIEWFEQLGIDPLPVEGAYYTPAESKACVEAGGDWLFNLWKSQENSASRPNDETDLDQHHPNGGEEETADEVFENPYEEPKPNSPEIQARLTYEDLTGLAQRRAWSSALLPTLGKWVQDNQRALDLACEASQRPQYRSPLVSTDDGYGLLTALRATEAQTRSLARGLSLRAMWNVGEGRFHKSQENILALHKLARLLGQNRDNLIVYLIAIAIDDLACEAYTVLASDLSAPRDVLATSLDQLRRSRGWLDAASVMDESERLSTLDAVLGIKRGTDTGLGFNWIEGVPRGSLDWNIILREINSGYDVASEALRMSDPAERAIAANALDEKVSLKKLGWSWKLQTAVSRTARSEAIARGLMAILLPSVEVIADAHDCSNMRLDLTITALALAVYRAEHGVYPQELKELVPDILDAVPQDLYSGKPLRYERRGEGYLLYSVFQDGKDNGGTHADRTVVAGEWISQDGAGWDMDDSDLVIRVPIPQLVVPMSNPGAAD